MAFRGWYALLEYRAALQTVEPKGLVAAAGLDEYVAHRGKGRMDWSQCTLPIERLWL